MSQKSQKYKMIEYIKTEYGAEPEFLWPERYPSYAVFRHGTDGKWFALVATISSKSLGLKDDRELDIINLKFDKNQTYDFAETNNHIFPAYHMNKDNWITIILDGTLPNEMIEGLIKNSFMLTD